MAIIKTNPQWYTQIGNAIRTRLGTTVRYQNSEMAGLIGAITGSAVSDFSSSAVLSTPVSDTWVLTDDQYYRDIASAIREVNGLSTQYNPSEMGAAILALAVVKQKFYVSASRNRSVWEYCSFILSHTLSYDTSSRAYYGELEEGTTLIATLNQYTSDFNTTLKCTVDGTEIDISEYADKLYASYEDGPMTLTIPVTGEIAITAIRIYTVTSNLTNVINTNTSITVNEGDAYDVMLEADDGYELSNITVTMGGNTVVDEFFSSNTTLYSKQISNVTGDIVISASATEYIEIIEPYTVAKEDGATHGFTLTDGWYVRDNAGIHSSCALARITFTLSEAKTVKFTVVNDAEARYDYGVLSTIDNTLTNASDYNSHTSDVSAGKVHFNGYTSSTTNEQTVTYDMPSGTHFVIAKYIKDVSGNVNQDMFKFKIEIL